MTDDEALDDASTNDVIGAESEYVRGVNTAVGEVIRDVRESKLWTLPEFLKQMQPWPVRLNSVQAQQNYETGKRPMSIAILLAECWTMGVSPYEVVQEVAHRVNEERSGVLLDLDAMIEDCQTIQLRDWATIQRRNHMGNYWLSPRQRDEICALVGLPLEFVVSILAPFTVGFDPRR
jgi:hypothetical protein